MESRAIKNQPVIIEGPHFQGDISFHNWVCKKKPVLHIEQGILLKDFADAKDTRDLESEYRLLKQITGTEEHKGNLKILQANDIKLNRYTDIRPYNQNEIILPNACPDNDSTYANASSVSGALITDKDRFIATQGPVALSIPSFWEMIWENNTGLILMLCKCLEGGRKKCEFYFPQTKEESVKTHRFEIQYLNEHKLYDTLTIRKFRIRQMATSMERVVHHVHYEDWPDHGVPEGSSYPILGYVIDRIREEVAGKPDNKIVVHCSAGVGRTGTIIALYNAITSIEHQLENFPGEYSPWEEVASAEEFKQTPRLSLFGIVRRLREQRVSMVQTKDQYIFLYEYMDEWIRKNVLSKYDKSPVNFDVEMDV